jgi:regulator of sigma E protease
VKPGSHFEQAGFRSGDRLWSIDGVSGTGIKVVPDGELPGLYPVREEKPRIVKVQVDRAGEKDKVSLELRTAEVVEADLAAVGFATSKNFLKRVDGRPYRRRPFGEAFKEGLYEPLDIGIMTFEVLKKLVTGGESARGLSGPLGIFHASFKFAELHFGNFVWLLCLITVNLGIFNLLPIPVLDGGHNVLLAIEVVRKWFGKPPPSEKFVVSFQYAGLFFILALFLFVTFNDVSRLF